MAKGQLEEMDASFAQRGDHTAVVSHAAGCVWVCGKSAEYAVVMQPSEGKVDKAVTSLEWLWGVVGLGAERVFVVDSVEGGRVGLAELVHRKPVWVCAGQQHVARVDDVAASELVGALWVTGTEWLCVYSHNVVVLYDAHNGHTVTAQEPDVDVGRLTVVRYVAGLSQLWGFVTRGHVIVVWDVSGKFVQTIDVTRFVSAADNGLWIAALRAVCLYDVTNAAAICAGLLAQLHQGEARVRGCEDVAASHGGGAVVAEPRRRGQNGGRDVLLRAARSCAGGRQTRAHFPRGPQQARASGGARRRTARQGLT